MARIVDFFLVIQIIEYLRHSNIGTNFEIIPTLRISANINNFKQKIPQPGARLCGACEPVEGF
jgi:hypothetical protein